MSSDAGVVHFERRGAVAFLTFDRPAARNAMTWPMYEQLRDALTGLVPEDGVRVAVLRGAGRSFIAGTDIAQFTQFSTGDDGIAYEQRLEEIVALLEAVPLPTLAVIEGYAVGGGLALAAACDFRICTPDARFGVPIARTVGNCLSVANVARLVAHLGPARTKTLLLAAELIDADAAHVAGFVKEIVEPAEIDTRVDALCQQLASHAPITMQVSKEAIRRVIAATVSSSDDLIRRAYGSRDFHEGVAAFVAKRAPQWEGK